MKNPKPKIRLLYSDATPAGFLYNLYINSKSAGLIEDEAGRIFNSRIVDDLGLLNKVWDARSVTVDRRSGSFCVREPRATISWMVQPAIFSKYMDRKGESARGIGFLARCLVSYPQSTQGTRFLMNGIMDVEKIDAFRCRIRTLLEDQLELLTPEVQSDEE